MTPEDHGRAVIARSLKLEVCSRCGEPAGASAHGHTDAPDWHWERLEYVPAAQHQGAVEALGDAWGYLIHDEQDAAMVVIERAAVELGVNLDSPGERGR